MIIKPRNTFRIKKKAILFVKLSAIIIFCRHLQWNFQYCNFTLKF